MHIESITIDITIEAPAQPSMLPIVSTLLSNIAKAQAKPASQATEAPAVTPIATLTPPTIGEYWAGQGGIYAGLTRGVDGQPDQHLVLATAEPEGNLDWDGALAWAKGLEVDGHADFHVPTRFESALVYANLQDKVNTGRWHWTSTQHSEGYAWLQYFDNGTQNGYDKSFQARARAVRRFSA